MKSVKILLLATLTLVSQSSFAYFEDVSINSKTGDTFIIEVKNNPSGELLLLNDHDPNLRKTFQLLDKPIENANFEIELNKSNSLTYLVQSGDYWFLGSMLKGTDGLWKKSPVLNNISGKGIASNLKSLPDGNLSFIVNKKYIIVKSDPQSGLTIIDKINHISSDKVDEIIKNEVTMINTEETNHLSESNNSTPPQSDFNYKNGFGFAAGATTGVGFAYRRHLTEKWGMQVAGIFFADGDSLSANLGATVMRTLHQTKKVRFYALSGVSAFYSGDNEEDWDACNNEYPDYYETGNESNFNNCLEDSESWRNETNVNFGIGIGIEFIVLDNIGISLELPLTVQLSFDDDGLNDIGVYPIPNGSLIYYF